MSEQQRPQQRRESDGKMPSLWNCGPFDGNMACGGGGDDADDSIVEETPPLRPQQRVRNLVDGILSPFMACVQPNLQACMAPTTDWEPQQSCYPMYNPASTSRRSSSSSRREATAGSPAVAHPVVLSSVPSQAAVPSTITRTTPNENDVLCGRGNNSTRHPGNRNFRDLIAANKSIYGTLTKKEKMLLARQIVDLILHTTDPPARFLGRDTSTGLWYDIGMPRSLEKTSQALREKSAAAKACAKLQASNNSEIKTVLSSDSTVADKETLSDVGSGASESLAGVGEEKKASTPKHRNGPVEAPPVKIPLHLQQVYGFKGYRQRLQQVPPPPTDPYASSRHHHHHPAYSPQVFQRNAFQPSAAHLQNPPPPPPPPEMHHQYSADQGNHHRHYSNEGHRRPYPPQQQQQQQPPPPSAPAQYASMLSPPRQSQPPAYPVVTPQPPHYQDQGYEVPPPLRNIVSSDSAPSAFPAEEKSSTVSVASSSFTRERPISNGKISPPREQEWKRQRVSDKTKRRLAAATDKTDNKKAESLNTSNESSGSSTGLTKAIETKLTLEDRVIRSPSAMMQSSISGRRRSLEQQPLPSLTKQEQSTLDMSTDSSMDGLTALSTAAFLRLDESY